MYQSAKIYPYTPLATYEVGESTHSNPSKTIKIFTANVLQENKNSSDLLAEVNNYDADILILTETDLRWQNDIEPTIKTDYKYQVEIPLSNTYGMLLYSKYQLVDPQVKFLVDDSIPSIHTLVKLHSGDTIQLFAIHPTPPIPQENLRSTDRDAELMKIALLSIDAKYPVITAGDFNDVAWSQSTRLFQKVSGLLDIRKGRGFFNTYNANNIILRWPLDHIFVSEHFRVSAAEKGSCIGSDHFPIFVSLTLESNKATEQRADPPTEKQLEKARKQIEKEKKELEE